jgi:hypothetical protein
MDYLELLEDLEVDSGGRGDNRSRRIVHGDEKKGSKLD